MKQWLNQHQQALQIVLTRMRHNLLATLLMFCVMGVTLCLPGILYVIVDNLNRLAGDIKGEPQISLFLKQDIKADTINDLDKKLSLHAAVKTYRFVSKDTAWQDLQATSGTAEITHNLEKNPLPDAYFVTPRNLEPVAIEALQQEMQQWSGVEIAQADANWVKRLYAMLELGKKAILALVLLLGFALIAIIGNTIRLQILTQREEIEVSRLIGATDRFIRRPFLYAGAIYGLGGGLAATLFLASVITLFNSSVTEIAASYGSNFHLALPSLATSLIMIASALSLGWIGSYIAVGRSLSKLN
ncbi:MAG: permease-like cell division protein FtsX [Methylophilaceae bacterium]|nr:permease-like cell division protein FtsX [Methyloradius sp.]